MDSISDMCMLEHILCSVSTSFLLQNILLNSDGHCVLTDFGLAKDFTGNSNENEDERARTLCGTMEYMAPVSLSI